MVDSPESDCTIYREGDESTDSTWKTLTPLAQRYLEIIDTMDSGACEFPGFIADICGRDSEAEAWLPKALASKESVAHCIGRIQHLAQQGNREAARTMLHNAYRYVDELESKLDECASSPEFDLAEPNKDEARGNAAILQASLVLVPCHCVDVRVAGSRNICPPIPKP